MEQIDSARIETDEDGAHLFLEGDFTDTFEDYLSRIDHNDPRYCQIALAIPRNVAHDLYYELEKVLRVA